MATAGPGSIVQSTDNPLPLLWYATDQDVVQVYNPLTDDFAALVAVDKPINTPFQVRKTEGAEAATNSEEAVRNAYGVNLKNPDYPSRQHIGTNVLIKAGETKSLLGGVAKVAVNQLVTEIMQREGNSLKMADPHARLLVEQRVVVGTRSIQEVMSADYRSEHQQVIDAVDKLNQGSNYEPETTAEGSGATDQANRPVETPETVGAKRGPGRPKQSQPNA